jgi:signal transduction histidine kinase
MRASAEHHDKIIELSELAGGLAHEIRNPLSTLKVNLQLLCEDLQQAQVEVAIDTDLRRRALQRLETLRSETDRLQQLLDDFLNLVGRHDIKAERVDLNEVVQHVVGFVHPQVESQAIQLRVNLSPQPLLCDVDSSLIKQALLNLCLNSQEAMPAGGELTVHTHADGDWAVIEVSDSGIGIEAQLIGSVFKPFFSTKRGGSGLGLSLTRRIIMEHGGTIGVHSELGKGTCFTMRIPRGGAAPAESTSA